MLPNSDTVLLWLWTSPDSHFNLTAGRIAAKLKSLLVVEDAEMSNMELLALLKLFTTGPICQTADIVIS
jgi:hypothetical protein